MLKPNSLLGQMPGDTLSDTTAYVPPYTTGGTTSGGGTLLGGTCVNSLQWSQIGSTDDILKCPPEGRVGIGVTSFSGNHKLEVEGGENSTYYEQSNTAKFWKSIDIDASSYTIEGSSWMAAGRTESWGQNVRLFGSQAIANINSIHNNSSVTSRIAGGKYVVSLQDPLQSSGAGTGTYYIGGMMSRLTGTVNAKPENGAIAAVIARDEINNDYTYAGYFEGKTFFTDNVGIGASTPEALLHVRLPNSSLNFIRFEGLRSVTNGHAVRIELNAPNSPSAADKKNFHIINANQASGGSNRLIFRAAADDGANFVNIMNMDHNGKVSIGNVNTPGDYRLYVEGGILAERVRVAVKNTTEWADHVFEDDYSLMPLKDVETFIQTYRHLPGVPSAKEVVKQE